MGLRNALARVATRRPRVHLLEAPGGAVVRFAVEQELDRRGWSPAPGPSAADALVVAGDLPPALSEAAELVWSQLPGPRVRTTIADPDDVPASLDQVRRGLCDLDLQRRDARERGLDETERWIESDEEEEMAPGGIPLAEGAEDRDGLEMDVLVHPLGPLLNHWPGGLELRTTLHGDVVAEATVRWWGGQESRPQAPESAAAAWDAVSVVLALVGQDHWARPARSLRDDPARDDPARQPDRRRLRSHLERLGRWSVLPSEVVSTLGRLLDDPGQDLLGPQELEALAIGRDLGDVRLLVAAHAPLLRPVPSETSDEPREETSRA